MNAPARFQWHAAVIEPARVAWPGLTVAAVDGSAVRGNSFDFFLFAVTPPGVAAFHHHVPAVAPSGLAGRVRPLVPGVF